MVIISLILENLFFSFSLFFSLSFDFPKLSFICFKLFFNPVLLLWCLFSFILLLISYTSFPLFLLWYLFFLYLALSSVTDLNWILSFCISLIKVSLSLLVLNICILYSCLNTWFSFCNSINWSSYLSMTILLSFIISSSFLFFSLVLINSLFISIINLEGFVTYISLLLYKVIPFLFLFKRFSFFCNNCSYMNILVFKCSFSSLNLIVDSKYVCCDICILLVNSEFFFLKFSFWLYKLKFSCWILEIIVDSFSFGFNFEKKLSIIDLFIFKLELRSSICNFSWAFSSFNE